MSSLVDVLRTRIDPPRTLSFTRTGGYFVLVTLGVGIAAINTGNNLLFLLLGMMLSVIVASGLLSEADLRSLQARREPPIRLFADRPATGQLAVGNPTSWPSLSVELREADVECTVGPLAGRRIEPDRSPWWKFWSRNDEEPPGVAGAYFLRIESGASDRLEVHYEFPARGIYELRTLQLVTRFPFHLFEKARDLSRDETVVVYPEPRPAPDWVTELHAGFGDVPASEQGRGDEYFGLHEYRQGEDRRLIHWKRSAARGELIVKEFEAEHSRSLYLHLCNALPDGADAGAERTFEEGLERLTGLIQTVTERGWDVGLRTLDADVPPRESTGLDAVLRTIARTSLHEQLPEAGFPSRGSSPVSAADILVAFPGAGEALDGDWHATLSLEPDPPK